MMYNRAGELLEQRDPMGRTLVTEKLLPSLFYAASGKSVTAKTISHSAQFYIFSVACADY